MERAYKFRVYPNRTQENLIQKTFGCVRYVYNQYLSEHIYEYKINNWYLSYGEASKRLTILKTEYEWLKKVDKCSLQNALKDLDRAYRNFFRDQKVGYPKFKSKKNHRRSYRTNCNIKVLDNRIQIPKVGKVRFRDKQKVQGRILNATISQEPSGKYYISICCTDIENIGQYAKTGKQVGIDLGIKDFVITSDSERFGNPKYLKKSIKKLKRCQRQLSRKTKDSSNWHKARVKLAKVYEYVTNQRRDKLNKVSTKLVKIYDVICLEDLQVKNMVKNHKLAQNIADVSWSEFVRKLSYKAEWHGKTLVKIDKFYPSSQLCSHCGYRSDVTKDLRVRIWTCPECHTQHDRDINAAINILNEGKRILSIA